jgi:hypothetical protein
MKTIKTTVVHKILSAESDSELTRLVAGQNVIALRQLFVLRLDIGLIYFLRTSAEVCEI